MPIFEFKCSGCEEFFEILFMSGDDEKEIKCPKCSSESFERIVSRTNYTMAASGTGRKQGSPKLERSCSSGSCTTYTVPGETRD